MIRGKEKECRELAYLGQERHFPIVYEWQNSCLRIQENTKTSKFVYIVLIEVSPQFIVMEHQRTHQHCRKRALVRRVL